MQYVQQGIAEVLTDAVTRLGPLGAGDYASVTTRERLLGRVDILPSVIGFKDQDVNQHLALIGSLDGDLATLDLSEASDRVSNQHVRLLFARFPHLFEATQACRSRKADVPGKGVIRLAKFASMGSALTFPIEALIFSVLVFIGIENASSHRLTPGRIKRLRSRVRIFGDDIIVPKEFAESVISTLDTFGYRVNTDKSFWNGKFRESCGKEYYSGTDVSIVRLRSMLPTSRKDDLEVISSVSFRNQCYNTGLWRTARFMDQLLGRMIPFPAVESTSPILGRHSFLGHDTERVCPHLHKPLVKGMMVVSTPPKSPLDGVDALMKYFLKRGDLPFADREHLDRSGRPLSVRIKLRVGSSY